MKLLLLPLLLTGAGLGGYGLRGAADHPPRAQAGACRIEVECADRDTCIVTCYDADGSVHCREEIACERPCEDACETPCELPEACRTR